MTDLRMPWRENIDPEVWSQPVPVKRIDARLCVWPDGWCPDCNHREYRHWEQNAPCCSGCKTVLPNPPILVLTDEAPE